MACIRFELDEFFDRDLPPLCIACGRPVYRFEAREYRVGSSETRYGGQVRRQTNVETIRIPVCREHCDANDDISVVAMGSNTIVLERVSKRFADALRDYREGRFPLPPIELDPSEGDLSPDRAPRSTHKNRPRVIDPEPDEVEPGHSYSTGWAIGILLSVLGIIIAAVVGFLRRRR